MGEESNPHDSQFSRKYHKRKIKRTLLHLSSIYLFICTSYRSLEFTHSSLNFEEGLGTVSLSVLYSAFSLSCLCIGPVVVSIIKPKWALLIGCIVHTLYVLANVWPRWATLVPASVALGTVSAFIWITQGTYITNMALEYSRHSKYTFEVLLSKFLAIFFLIYGFSAPLGSLICSVVLGQELEAISDTDNQVTVTEFQPSTTVTDGLNHTPTIQQEICGSNHCPYMETHTEVLRRPNQTVMYILIGIFLGFDIMGVTLSCLLPGVPNPQQVPVKTKLLNIVSIFKSVDLMLMIPLYYFLGIYSAVFFGSVSLSFVSCPYGVEYVGYTTMAEGTAFVLFSLISNPMAKVLSRPVKMAILISVAVGEVTVWMLWIPGEGQFWILIVLAGFFGISRAVLTIQNHALTSLLFPHCPESAYGQTNIWQGFGYITGFAISSKLCFFTKGWLVLGCTGLVIISYILIEIRLKIKKIEKVRFVGQKETEVYHLDRIENSSQTAKEQGRSLDTFSTVAKEDKNCNTETVTVANNNSKSVT